MSGTEAGSRSEDDSDYSFLLFYHYTAVENPQLLCSKQTDVCLKLNLNGRIRISTEGINGTLGGSRGEVQKYIDTMDSDEDIKTTQPIHWKLSGLLATRPPHEQKLKSLSVKVTKEVVSLDLSKQIQDAVVAAGPGIHMTPQEFHETLQLISNQIEKDSAPAVDQFKLVDMRNHYEVRIGKFEIETSEGQVLAAVNPQTRQFSEIADFFDAHIDEYLGKKVLMYCTGGVRCERASAYLRYKGVDEVFQLSGGIHSYQEAFPDGGFFRGKNFVFDPRGALPSPGNEEDVIGRCLVCEAYFDSYEAQKRCSRCRMLVLICKRCENDSDVVNILLCEFCVAKTS